MRITTAILFAALALPFGASAEPGTRDPGVNQRQQNQKGRIKEGVQSGDLTKSEAKGLREERHAIHEKEKAYKADGSLTKDERKDLHSDLRDSSQNIHSEKHDAQTPATRDPVVNQRQHNQHGRVAKGVQSGNLTQSEAAALRDERRAIREKEKAYKSDGSLTKDERKDLHSDLNDASKNIHSEKHDTEIRP